MTRARLPFLIALAVTLLGVKIAAGVLSARADRQNRERRTAAIEQLHSMNLTPPLTDAKPGECSPYAIRCLRSPLAPKLSLASMTRTLQRVGQVAESNCGRPTPSPARSLIVCDLRTEVGGESVMVFLSPKLDVGASRKAASPQFDGSIADVLLLDDLS